MWILAVVLLICVLAFSARYPWWFFPKKGLVVLMYHHIGENKDRWYVSQKTFAKQLDVLIKNNFVPISFEDLNKAYQGLSDLPKKPVLITFDDGWLDNYTQAFPVLKNKNIKANIFLTYNFIDSGKDYMTWHHIIEMQKSGLINFGSHLMNHKKLSSLEDKEKIFELQESKLLLEKKLDTTITSFAYPHGDGAFDKNIRELVFKSGYLFDYSVRRGINKIKWNNAFGPLRRITVENGQSILEFYLQITRGKSGF